MTGVQTCALPILDHAGALEMMAACYTRESDGLSASAKTHRTAAGSYRHFVEPVTHLDRHNLEMAHMRANSEAQWLQRNRRALARRVSGNHLAGAEAA